MPGGWNCCSLSGCRDGCADGTALAPGASTQFPSVQPCSETRGLTLLILGLREHHKVPAVVSFA